MHSRQYGVLCLVFSSCLALKQTCFADRHRFLRSIAPPATHGTTHPGARKQKSSSGALVGGTSPGRAEIVDGLIGTASDIDVVWLDYAADYAGRIVADTDLLERIEKDNTTRTAQNVVKVLEEVDTQEQAANRDAYADFSAERKHLIPVASSANGTAPDEEFHDAMNHTEWWIKAALEEVQSQEFFKKVFLGAVHGVVRNLKFLITTLTTLSSSYKSLIPLVALMPYIEDLLSGVDKTGLLGTNLIRSRIIPRIPYFKFFGEAFDVKERSKTTRDESKKQRQKTYDHIQLALLRFSVRPEFVDESQIPDEYRWLDRIATSLYAIFKVPGIFALFDHILYFSIFAQEEIADWLDPEKVAGKAAKEVGSLVHDQIKGNPYVDAFFLRCASLLKLVK